MTELSLSTAAAPGVLVVAGLVSVAVALWWWPRSWHDGDPAGMRQLLADDDGPTSSALRDPERERQRGGRGARFWRPGHRRSPQPQARAPTGDEAAGGMVLLAVALQSGCGVVEAIEAAADVAPAAAGHELAVVAAALRWGVADDLAWGAVSPVWRRTSVALRLAAVSGVAPSTLLLSGADDLRAARLASVEVAAARLGVRLVGPLGLAFLPAFVLTTVVPVVVAVAGQVLAS